MTVKAKEGGLRTKMLMYLERPEGARHQRGGAPVGRRTSSPVTPHIWGGGARFKMDHLFISNVMVILFIHGASRNMIILIQSWAYFSVRQSQSVCTMGVFVGYIDGGEGRVFLGLVLRIRSSVALWQMHCGQDESLGFTNGVLPPMHPLNWSMFWGKKSANVLKAWIQ